MGKDAMLNLEGSSRSDVGKEAEDMPSDYLFFGGQEYCNCLRAQAPNFTSDLHPISQFDHAQLDIADISLLGKLNDS
jgi:hypothetical protein